MKEELGAISGIFFGINLIVSAVAAFFNKQQIISVLLLLDPSLFVALYALIHRNIPGWIIMVGTLAGTVYTVVINQLVILEILGAILFFSSFIVMLFWVGTGTDSEDTGSIRPRLLERSSNPWQDCWGKCCSPTERYVMRHALRNFTNDDEC